jgi:D-hexose-6-phosphate mutarotase
MYYLDFFLTFATANCVLIYEWSEAEIYLFGGCVTSWKVPSGKDLLFVRPDAVFNGQKPIRSVSRLIG